ncbi:MULTISPECIES: chemotaxis protein CheB [Nostocales]|uniref:protein-glutamate methylesterase n=3 Tax=Nostocales TaxID=1161 RepID=A0A0C1N875_9CYAN|nr:chemotaxis protein CheB [Tolypothrix bouteillei]KAF3886865.1 chemotaxis protein CheB [Tolypothrix bouteillei VB521301]
MPGHDIIVVGASAGGVEALTLLVKNLPKDLNAAVLIVLHIPSYSSSVLPRILERAGNLPAVHARDGEPLLLGRIYIAPPNYHLLVKPGTLQLTLGPRENSHRPAIDPLFRTAARAYGQRVIGVVLTGSLDDGTAGLKAVKMRGGVAVVQSPEDALYAGMPRNAIENVNDVDYVLPLSDIPSKLIDLVNTPVEVGGEDPIPEELAFESDLAEMKMAPLNNDDKPGKPSPFACPDCGGTLWDLSDRDLLRFRCRTGHAFSGATLLAKQSDALEDALWIALRALEERASLANRMSQRMRERNQTLSAIRLEEEAKDAQKRAAVIQEVLLKSDGMTKDKDLSSLSLEEPIKE